MTSFDIVTRLLMRDPYEPKGIKQKILVTKVGLLNRILAGVSLSILPNRTPARKASLLEIQSFISLGSDNIIFGSANVKNYSNLLDTCLCLTEFK